MNPQIANILFILIVNLIHVPHFCMTNERHSIKPSGDVKDSSGALNVFLRTIEETTANDSKVLGKLKNERKHESLMRHNEKPEGVYTPSFRERIKDREDNRKRWSALSNVDKDTEMDLFQKRKKAKALGQFLLNKVSSKSYDNLYDYDDEDDDYSKGLNQEKMNWQDYQNEDGASIMELIALNARHKTKMHHSHQARYLH